MTGKRLMAIRYGIYVFGLVCAGIVNGQLKGSSTALARFFLVSIIIVAAYCGAIAAESWARRTKK
jgi:uncharacterized membrane protein